MASVTGRTRPTTARRASAGGQRTRVCAVVPIPVTLLLVATLASGAQLEHAGSPHAPPGALVVTPGAAVDLSPDCRNPEFIVLGGPVTVRGELRLSLAQCGSDAASVTQVTLAASAFYLAPGGVLFVEDGSDRRSTESTGECGTQVRHVRGLDGARGVTLTLDARQIVLLGTVHISNGGSGGDAVARGCPGTQLVAVGGDGGPSGHLVLRAPWIEDSAARTGGVGGSGGTAFAAHTGFANPDAYGTNGTHIVAPDGGDANETGLDAGREGIDGRDAEPVYAFGGHGAIGVLQGGRGGNASAVGGRGGDGADTAWPAIRGGNGGAGSNAQANGGNGGSGPIGGVGGTAEGYAGAAGGGGNWSNDEPEKRGAAGQGGHGGIATAEGGDGDFGLVIAGGGGGSAVAHGGRGGPGGHGTGFDARGGDGGIGGRSEAVGGTGGIAIAGTGGAGGAAAAQAGDSGNGGDGTLDPGLGAARATVSAQGGDGGAGFNGGAGGSASAVEGRIGSDGRLLAPPIEVPRDSNTTAALTSREAPSVGPALIGLALLVQTSLACAMNRGRR